MGSKLLMASLRLAHTRVVRLRQKRSMSTSADPVNDLLANNEH